MNVRVAVIQTLTDVGARSKNIDNALAYLDRAAGLGAQIVCFPETYPGPWTPPLDYDPLPTLCEGAKKRGLYVAAGLIEPVPNRPEWFYNKMVLVGPDGELVGEYRRTSPYGPWIYKGSFFWDFNWQEASDLPIFNTAFCKIGFCICSEVYVPELARILAVKGAELIFFPAGVPKPDLWHTWRTLIWARAIENLCFTATGQNVFSPSDLGLAMICSPEEIILESAKEGVFVADCDLDRLRFLRETEDSHVFPGFKRCKPGIFKQWYRPELYQMALADVELARVR